MKLKVALTPRPPLVSVTNNGREMWGLGRPLAAFAGGLTMVVAGIVAAFIGAGTALLSPFIGRRVNVKWNGRPVVNPLAATVACAAVGVVAAATGVALAGIGAAVAVVGPPLAVVQVAAHAVLALPRALFTPSSRPRHQVAARGWVAPEPQWFDDMSRGRALPARGQAVAPAAATPAARGRDISL